MRWCLRIKLAQNWTRFGNVLEKTGQKPIVEESTKDSFWGAKPSGDGILLGMNVLGRLLIELREQYRDVESGRAESLKFPTISHFLLLGEPLNYIGERSDLNKEIQSSMF
jgi:NADAR domain